MASNPGGSADTVADADPSFVDDEGTRRCGVPKVSSDEQEPCRVPVPNGICCVHGDQDERIDAVTGGDTHVRAGLGSGDPGHSDGDGQPPEGNKNAMTHGIHASKNDPWGVLDHFRDERPAVYARIVRWFWHDISQVAFDAYIDGQAPDDPLGGEDVPGVDMGRLTSQAADLLLVSLHRAVMLSATLEQVTEGLAHTQQRATDDGMVEVIDENPVNLPKNRMRREDRFQLKDLGLRDQSPDAQAAQGKQDLAKAAERVANARDQRQQHQQQDQDDEQ